MFSPSSHLNLPFLSHPHAHTCMQHLFPCILNTTIYVRIHTPRSNPVVQREILQYKGLDLLCSLISAAQPELVQRRALFAISALLRGNPESQQPFIEECTGFQELALDFGNRIPQIQIKAVTLIADLLNEQVGRDHRIMWSVL